MKTFTKTLVLAGLLAAPLLADWDIEGQITAINACRLYPTDAAAD